MAEPRPVWPVYAACAALFAGLLGFGGGIAVLADQRAFTPLATFLALAAAAVTWTLAVAAAAAAAPGPGFVARLGLGRGRLSAGGTAIAIAGGLALSQAIDLALRLSGVGRGPALEAMIDALAPARGLSLGLAVLIVGLGAGVAEELFFRGFVQRRLVARHGAAVGIAVAAALFACAHGDPRHAAFAFGFGLFAGAIAHWSDSTRPAIALHVVNNVVAVLGIAFGLDGLETHIPRVALVVLCGALFAAAIASLRVVRRAAGWTPPTALG